MTNFKNIFNSSDEINYWLVFYDMVTNFSCYNQKRKSSERSKTKKESHCHYLCNSWSVAIPKDLLNWGRHSDMRRERQKKQRRK